MPFKALPLPTATVSSGGTAALPAWDNLDDALWISILPSVTTAPGMTVNVCLTATGTTFTPLSIMMAASSGTHSLATFVTASSGYVTRVEGGGFFQMRLGTSAASTGAITVTGVKWIQV